MKNQIRVLGIDDSSFDKFRDKKVWVIGTFFRGGDFMDGVMMTRARVDGNDSTDNIIKMIRKSKFRPQLQAILLDGIAVGGFNIIDIEKLNKKTKIPVIVIIRRFPDFKKIHSTLEKLGMQKKRKLIENAGKPIKIGKLYVQLRGISGQDAKELLRITCTHSDIPEPIRIAHLIGQALHMGESKGNA